MMVAKYWICKEETIFVLCLRSVGNNKIWKLFLGVIRSLELKIN